MLLRLMSKTVIALGKIHWPTKDVLSVSQKEEIKNFLTPSHFIIVTRRKNSLSTYFIGIADLALRCKWGHYSHVLMNLENEVHSKDDFKLIEAITSGTQVSTFDEVFDGVSSVALLKPKSMSVARWTEVLDRARTKVGTPYDDLFDLASQEQVSCVELVRFALMAEPNYERDFANFEKMIKKQRNLTPQTFYDCPDFEVVYEIRR